MGRLLSLAEITHTQMSMILCNMASVIALIVADTSRGIDYHRESLLCEIRPERGQWQYTVTLMDGGKDIRDARDTKRGRRKQEYQAVSHVQPLDNKEGKPGNTQPKPEQKQQNDDKADEGTNACSNDREEHKHGTKAKEGWSTMMECIECLKKYDKKPRKYTIHATSCSQ